MKRLFVCCDGTWNSAVDRKYGMPVPTNVVKFFNAVKEGDVGVDAVGNRITQLRYYHCGVGADESWFARLLDGATGGGLSKRILYAWHWLSSHYADGDEIYIVGFSRGAFTARSLAGMIHCCGLQPGADWAETRQIWLRYVSRKQQLGAKDKRSERRQTFAQSEKHGNAPDIKFLGVWDTVGALGVPRQYDPLGWFDSKYRFHDTTLSPIVKHAYHALALDEERSNFFPTLWTNSPEPDQVLEQRWFAGVHADIGGGYNDCGLSEITLKWMINKAEGCGAIFDRHMKGQIHPDSLSTLHDSLSPLYRWIGYQPRSVPALGAQTPHAPYCQRISREANLRRIRPPIAQAPYRVSLSLENCPEGHDIAVFADSPWNWSGLYLRKGVRYRFRIVGDHHWGIGNLAHGPEGFRGSFFRALLDPFKRISSANWLELCGGIASGETPSVNGDPPEMERLTIGRPLQDSPVEIAPRTSGYLYLFANDVLHFYGRNKGRVIVNVTMEPFAQTPVTRPPTDSEDEQLENPPTAPQPSPAGEGLVTK